ncbi:hypothetical protein ATANTOWER_007592 [Ataeniobius toweri]|uniref:Tetratricopeptide repeat protein n=1 Tax=Ataeniobius toweri TaxID=208326 RepID=A0ABU7BP82_9TELE|nr:hypothetical protein [Ataeniobius toweri]
MNQTSCCVRDVKSALALDPTCREAEALLLQLKEASEEARQQAVLRMLSDNLQEALCLINTALESSPEDGRLYLFRGILYRRLKEFTSAIEDLVQAAELSEPEEKKCFSRGLYAEATLLLNKAIKEEKNLAGLYLNRGGEVASPDLYLCLFEPVSAFVSFGKTLHPPCLLMVVRGPSGADCGAQGSLTAM